ncbi:complement component receptor 1-like protein isoform X6 [Strigops habroptila]|uniref:complement component receptor 1-like protein isoform X6 n=1 Tax=Strigops habroptila TaxID=2489341 RepID=UPI0011CF4A2A|nr:complement component receptor 1-like protein isoform X6 [Strigops habroptila]
MYKDTVSFKCHKGFTLRGNHTAQCQADKTWDPPVPACEQVVKCLRPPNITNGKLKGNISDTFSYGASVSYSCSPGYSLIGNAFINCTVKGTWSQPPPQCKEIRCVFPEVQGVKKAIRGNSYRSGTNVTLECDDGYTLEGINQIQCQEDFSWDPPVPACKLTSRKSGSVGVGVVAAGVLLLLGAGIAWKIISKQKEGLGTRAAANQAWGWTSVQRAAAGCREVVLTLKMECCGKKKKKKTLYYRNNINAPSAARI